MNKVIIFFTFILSVNLYAQSNNVLLSLIRGNEAIKNNDWNTAIYEFTEVIRSNQNEAVAYNGRGVALLRSQNIWGIETGRVVITESFFVHAKQSITDFTEPIRLNRNFAEAYLNLAIINFIMQISFSYVWFEEDDLDLFFFRFK